MIPALIQLIVYLLILGVLLAVLWYVIRELGLPEPIGRIVKVVVVVVVALVLIMLLLQLFGGGVGGLPKLT